MKPITEIIKDGEKREYLIRLLERIDAELSILRLKLERMGYCDNRKRDYRKI